MIGFKREKEEQLALANMLNRIILSAPNDDALTEGLARELKRLMSFDWAAIANIESADIVSLSPLASSISSSLDSGNTFSVTGTPIAWVVEHKCTSLETDLSQDRHFEMNTCWQRQGMNSVVFLPLFYQREVFATLILASRRANAYKERELKLLRYAASQLATQLKNFQLLAWNQRREKWMAILDTLMVTITSGEELSEVFPQLAQGLKKVIPFDRIALTSVEGETLRIVDALPQEKHRPWLGEIYPVEDSAIPWMIEHRRINVEEDFAQKQQFPIDEIHLKEGLRAEVRVPFFSRGKLFASLHLLNSQPYHPEQEELALLSKLSYYLTGPMESLIYHFPVKGVAALV